MAASTWIILLTIFSCANYASSKSPVCEVTQSESKEVTETLCPSFVSVTDVRGRIPRRIVERTCSQPTNCNCAKNHKDYGCVQHRDTIDVYHFDESDGSDQIRLNRYASEPYVYNSSCVCENLNPQRGNLVSPLPVE